MELFKILGTVAVDTSDANKSLDKTTKHAQTSSIQIGKSFLRLAKIIGSTFAVHKIVQFGQTLVSTAGEVAAETAQFQAAFEGITDSATQMFNRVSEATGVLTTRLQVAGTKAFSQMKGAGMSMNDALEKTEVFLNLAADAAAYYDISLEDAEARIRSFMRGNVEAGDAIGLFTSESQRNAKALELYGRKWIQLTEAEKQNLMLNVAEDIYKQSGAIGQANREADGLANVTGNLKETWRQLLAVVGKPVMEAVIPIMQKVTEKFKELRAWVEQNAEVFNRLGSIIGGVVNALWSFIEGIMTCITWLNEHKAVLYTIISVLGVLIGLWLTNAIGTFMVNIGGLTGLMTILTSVTWGKVAASIADKAQTLALIALYAKDAIVRTASTIATKGMIVAQKALNLVMMSNPIGLVIAAIGALIAIGIVLYNKCEKFRNFINNMWESIKNTFNNVVNFFKEKINNMVNGIKNAFRSVGDFFKNMWENIKSAFKLPHLKVSGSWNPIEWFKGNPPKIGVEWYAKGGIMNEPTIFGMNPKTGNAMVGGEAGAEAIAPIATLQKYVSDSVKQETNGINENLDRLISMLATYLPQLIVGQDKQLVLDTGVLVGSIGHRLDYKLGEINKMKERGN